VRRSPKDGASWNCTTSSVITASPDFTTGLALINRVGEIAEALGHHPEIQLGWGDVRVTFWTYRRGGLTASDFEFAQRIDQLHS
jgi:4a-hydroxytetrahydrobiopterin dehydratase